MTNSLATLALAFLLSGTALAQQQPRRAKSSKAATSSSTDATGSTSSAANTQDATNGATAGTGLTNEQLQAQGAGSSTKQTTKVDARSSTRTSASSVKARKKSTKPGN
ncbi:hypothetical protein [Spirosoma areae]